MLPGTALAGPPAFVSNLSVSNYDGPEQPAPPTVLSVAVNAGGETTSVVFRYAPNPSSFCQTGSGASNTTAPQNIDESETSGGAQVTVTGLTGDYCAAAVATNASAPSGVSTDRVQFLAGGPLVGIAQLETTGPSTARVLVEGNAYDENTAFTAEYALTNSAFCASGGSSGLHLTGQTVNRSAGSGEALFNVLATGMTPGAEYCVFAVATSASSVRRVSERRDLTAGAPGFGGHSDAPAGVHEHSFSFWVHTANQETSVRIEYDESHPSPGGPACDNPVDPATKEVSATSIAAASTEVQVTPVTATGLTPGITYCFDVVLTNGSTSFRVNGLTFFAGLPEATNLTVSGITATSATVNADVTTLSLSTSAELRGALESSAWCQTEGASGTFGFYGNGAGLSTDGPVHLGLPTLEPDTEYCARIRVQNDRGVTESAFVHFATLPLPVNDSPPTITGTTIEGETLTASPGTWTSELPLAYNYVWFWCPPDPASDCIPIQASASPQYTLIDEDVGGTLLVGVTATSSSGAVTAFSGETAQIARKPPVSTALPVISGTPADGGVLTTTTGSWQSSEEPELAIIWQRCDAAGTACTSIADAGQPTLRLTAEDIGSRIRSGVIVAYSGGTLPAVYSEPTTVVTAGAPVNTAPPRIGRYFTPTARPYNVVFIGAWAGTPPVRLAIQWQRCGAPGDCTDIAGATGQTLTLLPGEPAAAIRFRVIATNAGGTTEAYSDLLPWTPEPVVRPPFSFSRLSAATTQTDRKLRSVRFRVEVNDASTVAARLYATRRGKRVLIGRLDRSVAGASSLVVTVGTKGRTLLGAARSAKLTLVVGVTGPGGERSERTTRMTLTRGKKR